MRKLTKQQIFDRAVGGVLRQGRLTMRGSACYYRVGRTPDGDACGVGHLILGEHYTRQMEGAAARHLSTPEYVTTGLNMDRLVMLGNALTASGVDTEDAGVQGLLAAIQTAHDSSSTLTDFVEYTKDLARLNGLNDNVCNTKARSHHG